jgi:hypothetical protein
MRDDGFFNLKALLVAIVVLCIVFIIMQRIGGCEFFPAKGCSDVVGGFKM